ncbi:MAG: class I SAM-dependent methyltransferase, partial [Spirochaetales bacterium]|nr:class I SAM-dependent methyltransferase [Spirochaetales bacterium]
DILGPELVIPKLLEFASPVEGLSVLDAGCGEGRISRKLHDLGADVMGIDVSQNLIDMAVDRRDGRDIEYRCLDLSDPPSLDLVGAFDLVVSNLAIDDAPEYVGFIGTICEMASERSRIVLSKNNSYSAVVRGKVENYFDTGKSVEYAGMASVGVKVFYYHRTFEDYINEFSKHGFFLSRMSDLNPNGISGIKNDNKRELIARYRRFPFLMVLEFTR